MALYQPSRPDRRGYGVIYSDIFNIKLVKLPHTPTTFEVMVVNIVIGTERFVSANIYHFSWHEHTGLSI